MTATTARIAVLESEVAALAQRLALVEGMAASDPGDRDLPPTPRPERVRFTAPAPERPVPAAPVRAAGPAAAPAPAAVPAPGPTLEQLLGGRVLAWAGGAAILAGLAFLFALGVSSGWLDESRRCLLGALFAGGLVAGGTLLQQRRGRTTAALAAIGAGVCGLYLAVAFATSAYDLLPDAVGALAAMGVGALGVRLALRWDASAIAGLGLVGAVLAPLVAGTLTGPAGLVLLLIATAAGTAVTVERRWTWLGAALALTATPQWIGALALADPAYGLAAVLATLIAFGVLGAAAAVGHELRAPSGAVDAVPVLLLLGSSAVLALAGYALVETAATTGAAVAWLAALAAAHLAAVRRLRAADRLEDLLSQVALTGGIVLAEVAFALAVDGPARAAAWIALLPLLAALTRRTLATDDHRAAVTLVGVHAVLGGLGAAAEVAAALDAGGLTPVAGALVGGLALAAGGAARLLFEDAVREALDVLALAALAVLAALTLDGVVLTLVLAAAGAALAVLAQRTDDRIAAGGALAALAAAAGWCLADQAVPEGLAGPLTALGTASLGLAAVVAATALSARRLAASLSFNTWAGPLVAAAAGAALYLASLVAVAVQPFSGDDMQGQLQLSALWAAAGTAGLIAGLRRDVAVLRTAALALLALAAGKLFLIDLQTLAAAWRVAACIAVGLLLLAAAYAHARLRPEPLPDLRDAQTAFR